MSTFTKETLARHLAAGGTVEWRFFWGHTPKTPGVVDQSCLSQWWPCDFEVDGVRYASAEHFMMAEKARTFGDTASLAKILACATPAEAKKLGRQVTPFEPRRWDAVKLEAVVRGNVAKFSASPSLRDFLLGTGEQVLVEAAPRDVVWGIGLGASNPKSKDPTQWRGRNLLGFALMEARARLRAGATSRP